jgi:hypothetical protein
MKKDKKGFLMISQNKTAKLLRGHDGGQYIGQTKDVAIDSDGTITITALLNEKGLEIIKDFKSISMGLENPHDR